MPPKRNRATEASLENASKTPKRTDLSVFEHHTMICRYNANGKNQTRTANHFKPSFPKRNQSTISRLLKNEAQVKELIAEGVNSSSQRHRKTKHPAFESAMIEWFCRVDSFLKIRIKGEMLKQIGFQFYYLLEILD